MASFWVGTGCYFATPNQADSMLKNYFKIAFRNLIKHKLFTSLNIFGLATGMACSILIFLWVQDERSYDQYHPQSGNLYRLTARISGIDAAVTQVPLAATLKKELPVVQLPHQLALVFLCPGRTDRPVDRFHYGKLSIGAGRHDQPGKLFAQGVAYH